MCVFVMLLNRFFWRKLYLLAQDQGRWKPHERQYPDRTA